MSPGLESTQHAEAKNSSGESSMYGFEGLAGSDFDLLGSSFGLLHAQDNMDELELAMCGYQIQKLQDFVEFSNSNDMYLDVVSAAIQSSKDERKIIPLDPLNRGPSEIKEKTSNRFPAASIQILREHGTRRLSLDAKKLNAISEIEYPNGGNQKPLTVSIIEVAAEKFIQSTSQSELSMLCHPYPGSRSRISEEDLTGVQLIQDLLYCAEKISEMQYERARKLLHGCFKMSSSAGTPVQRLAFYFVEGLLERIDKETGRITSRDLNDTPLDVLELAKWPSPILTACHLKLPLSQIGMFAGIQTIVEHVSEARKVHVVDFEIRSGIQCIVLMQALAARCENPVEHITVTAVSTISRTVIEETGRRLTSFAQSLNLKLSFHIVMLRDILDLNENLIKPDADEAVAVYAAYSFTRVIGMASRFENMMKVIKKLNPRVMIVAEIEANCNSPSFIGRFVEALFYFGAFFDSLADCMKNDERNRTGVESTCFRLSIRNVLAAEGEERRIRHVKINVWRAFFIHCGLVEIELSKLSLCHANLMRQQFACGSSCTLDRDGKCLTIGWKGTPLCSLSAWKFS